MFDLTIRVTGKKWVTIATLDSATCLATAQNYFHAKRMYVHNVHRVQFASTLRQQKNWIGESPNCRHFTQTVAPSTD